MARRKKDMRNFLQAPWHTSADARIRVAAMALLIVFASSAVAGDFQPLEDIRAAAIAAALPPGQANANSAAEVTLDAELHLPRCSEPLQAHISARSVAEVSCGGASGWRLYVPLRVTRSQQVLVVVRPLAAGQVVTADTLATETRDTAMLSGGLIYDINAALGHVAIRALVAGKPLVAEDLAAPRVVHRGEAVMLVARSGGIEVHAPGKALGDAGVAERINVENSSSHRIVQGIVRAGGEIEVAF